MTQHLGFFLVEDFSMMSVTAAIEPLRMVNRALGYDVYRWHYFSLDGQAVHASNGMKMDAQEHLGDASSMDYLFVCAGLNTDPPLRSKINAALQRLARTGMYIGALSGGAFILARAGLIGKRRCTAHWEYLPSLREAFPSLAIEETLFVADGKLLTCAGGMASMDMMLELVRETHGHEMARFAANQFQLDRVRDGREAQRGGSTTRLAHLPNEMQKAIHLMRENTETPLSITFIAEECALHQRRMERIFNTWLGLSPKAFYLNQRLEKAHDLLLHSNNGLADISQMTGFSSQSRFSTAYRRHYGETPSQTRHATR